MTVYDALLMGLTMVGAFNAALLVALWFTADRRGVLPDYWPYPALAALGGAVALLIGGEHAGVTARLSALEWALTAMSGPLLFDAVRRSGGGQGHGWIYGLAAAHFLVILFVAPRFGVPEILVAVAGQWLWTGIALIAWTRIEPGLPARRAAGLLVGLFLGVHVAQLMRMTFPGIFQDLVPAALAVFFALLTTILLLRSRALGGWFRAVDRTSRVQAGAALDRLDQWMTESHAYRAPDLRLGTAASEIGVKAEDLSRWLNDRGVSFADYLTRRRLDDAARCLRDPAEARTSIEAVGLLCGFASRSGFYTAFRKRFGVTPAAYRKAAAE